MAEPNKSNIDERLQFLLHSTESLHASTQELHATVAEHSRHIEALTTLAEHNEERWQRLERALRAALRAWLNGDDEPQGDQGTHE